MASQVAGFLLHNPLAALAVAGLAYYAIPRLTRAVVKFLVVPLALFATGYVAVSNPQASVHLLEALWNCKLLAHLVELLSHNHRESFWVLQLQRLAKWMMRVTHD